MKYVVLVTGIIIIMAAGFLYFNRQTVFKTVGWVESSDPRNLAYEINGEIVKLNNGSAETKSVDDPSVKTVTKYLGHEAVGDLNDDGNQDAAFFLNQESGGSGTFVYAAVALGTGTGYQGTNAVLIGDRITPRSIAFDNGIVVVNYWDRAPGEPMAVKPTVPYSLRLQIADGRLVKAQ